MSARQSPLPDWIYRQSAALPYRWRGSDLEVLLITSRGGKRWIVPKGIVEPGLSPQSSAAKETLEEAGVRGDVAHDAVGTYRRQKWGGTCEVSVYPLRVSEELANWPEAGSRQRRWMSVPEALSHVDEDGLRSVVSSLPEVCPDPETFVGQLRAPESPASLIYLLRHAEADPAAESGEDIDRALTPAGIEAMMRMHRYLSMADVHPDLILCSTARRARQTLDAVLPVVGEGASVGHLRDIYASDADALLHHLRDTTSNVGRVMVVGHNPALRSLVERLAGRSTSTAPPPFPAAALAILEFRGETWRDLADGSCDLHSLVAASDLG